VRLTLPDDLPGVEEKLYLPAIWYPSNLYRLLTGAIKKRGNRRIMKKLNILAYFSLTIESSFPHP